MPTFFNRITFAAVWLLLGLVVFTGLSCGSGGSVVADGNLEAADDQSGSGFISTDPSGLYDLIEPERSAAAVQTAANFGQFLPRQKVEIDGSSAVFSPDWDRAIRPPHLYPAYCTYAFNVGDFIGPGFLHLNWEQAPADPGNVWIGISDYHTETWAWLSAKEHYFVGLGSVSSLQNEDHYIIVAVVCLGTEEATLTSLSLITGDNMSPTAELEVPDYGSTTGPVLLDATGSRDSDGYIVRYDWDFEGDWNWDAITTEPSLEHIFDESGKHSVMVRVSDNLNAATVKTVEIMVYDEYEDNDDGTMGAPTTADLQNANPHPGADSGQFLGNCGAGGCDGDLEDFYDLRTTASDWYTVLLRNEPAVADLELEMLAANGDGTVSVLAQSRTTSDNESFSYQFTMGTHYYLRVYMAEGESDAAVTDYSLEVFSGRVEMPVAEFAMDPELGSPPMEVEFDASASTAGSAITTYDWDFNSDGTCDFSSAEPYAVYSYPALGDYTARLRITDEDGFTATVDHGVSVVPGMPVARCSTDVTEGGTALTVNFDASASYSDNGLIGYYWDFDNDGQYELSTTVPSAQFTFYLDGEYTVRLTVEDSLGLTDDKKVRINVIADYDEIEDNGSSGVANPFSGLNFDSWNGKIGPLVGDAVDASDWMSFEVSTLGGVHIYLDSYYDWGDIDMALVDADGFSVMTRSEHPTDRESIYYHFNIPGTYFLHVYKKTPGDESINGYEINMTYTPD